MNIYKISTLLFGLLFLTACGSLSDPYSIWNQTREVEAPVQNVAVGQAMSFNSGTFEGVGEGGWYGNVYVSITVNEDGEISDVEVSHGETPEFAEHALETLIPATIRTNGVGLDVVAGATYTSNAFIAAVQNALENAGGTTVYYHWDTTVATSGSFNPGTYVGVGTGGWYGNVEVSVSIDDNGQIYLVYVVYSQETPEFAEHAFNNLIPAVINTQSGNLDIVAGATATSNAFIEAVQNALNEASQ